MKGLKNRTLEERANKVGVSFDSGPEDELSAREARVFAAEKALRDERLWIIALVSALASVGSAIAAAISAWKN